MCITILFHGVWHKIDSTLCHSVDTMPLILMRGITLLTSSREMSLISHLWRSTVDTSQWNVLDFSCLTSCLVFFYFSCANRITGRLFANTNNPNHSLSTVNHNCDNVSRIYHKLFTEFIKVLIIFYLICLVFDIHCY